MARIDFPPNPKKNNYRNSDAVKNVVNYILNEKKTPDGIIGAKGVLAINKKSIIEDMLKVQHHYRKCNGKRAVHFWLSFSNKEACVLAKLEYLKIGYAIMDFFEGYQAVFALHQNTGNPHIHFCINPVNYYTGRKIHWQKKDTAYLKENIKFIMRTIY